MQQASGRFIVNLSEDRGQRLDLTHNYSCGTFFSDTRGSVLWCCCGWNISGAGTSTGAIEEKLEGRQFDPA